MLPQAAVNVTLHACDWKAGVTCDWPAAGLLTSRKPKTENQQTGWACRVLRKRNASAPRGASCLLCW